MKLTTHFHLVSKSRIEGAISPIPYIPSRCVRGQLYLHLLLLSITLTDFRNSGAYLSTYFNTNTLWPYNQSALFPFHTFDEWRSRKRLKERCQNMVFCSQRHWVQRRNCIALTNNTWRTTVCLWISLCHPFSDAFSYKFIVPCWSFWHENAGRNSIDLPSCSSSSVISSISELVHCAGKSPHPISQEI